MLPDTSCRSMVAGRRANRRGISIPAYLDAASAAVMEMGGKVAKKLGDGLMARRDMPALWC
jgi:hypothetical protein